MPEMSGYEVCCKIRDDSATAMLPVVMVTALDPAEERVKGIDAGADDFLTKPINQAELLARVKSLLRIKELARHRPNSSGSTCWIGTRLWSGGFRNNWSSWNDWNG